MADGTTFLHLTHDRAIEEQAQEEYRRSRDRRWPGAVVPTVARLAALAALLPDWPANGAARFRTASAYLGWAARIVREGATSAQDVAHLTALVARDGVPARVLDPFAGRASLLAPLGRTVRAVAVEREHAAVRLARDAVGAGALRGSAARLPFGGGRFDAVVTDPPYYDLIPYESVGGGPATAFDTAAFERMLEAGFREMGRVVAPGGRVVVLNTPKLLGFLGPLSRSGLTVAGAAMINVKEPLGAIAGTGRWWGSRILLLDCRRPGDARRTAPRTLAEHRYGWDRTVTECVEALPAAPPDDLAGFVRQKRAAMIRDSVADAFGGPPPGPYAAFAVAWCAQFGVPETSRDEAEVLARACGLTLDEPVAQGLLRLDGQVARLAPPRGWATALHAATALDRAGGTARALGTAEWWRQSGEEGRA